MTWVRLDDQFADHPKVVGLSHRAFRLHITAICYAARQETDGLIPKAMPFVVAERKAVGELLVAGLWDHDPAGFRVHDYLDYNPSAADLSSKRNSKAMAGAKGAASRWHDRKNAPDPTRPVPVPIPNPSSSARARKARDFYEAVTKRAPENAVMEQILDDIDFAHGEKCVAWAFEAAAGKEQPWPYTKRILDKCILEGHGPRSSNGANNQPHRARGAGNHRGKPEESGDWVADIIAEQRRTDAALGRPDRNAPGDAAAVLEQDV